MALARVVLAAAALVVAMQMAAGPASAAEPNPRAAQLFTEKLNSLHHEGAKLGYRIFELHKTIVSFRDGEIAEDELKRTFEPAFADLSSDVHEYRRNFPLKLEPPASGSSARDESLHAFATVMADLPGWLAAMLPVLKDLRVAAVAEDEAAYDRGMADILEHKANLSVFRIMLLKNSLYDVNPDEPEYLDKLRLGLTLATITTNVADGIGIRIVAKTYRSGSFDMSSDMRSAEGALRRAEEAVAASEAIGRKMSRQAANGELPREQALQLEFYVKFFALDAARSKKRITATRQFLNTLRAASNGESTMTKSVMLEAVAVLDAANQQAIADMRDPTRLLFDEFKRAAEAD